MFKILAIQLFNGGISLQQIFIYYAELCLIMSPLTVITLIVLSKKTAFLEKFNQFLDKITGTKSKEEKEGDKGKQEKSTPEKNPGKPEISSFVLPVGDGYKCHLDTNNKTTAEIIWEIDNLFIGEIDEDGNFQSRKTGEVNIMYRDRSYGPEMQAYSINVVPTNPDWFAENLIKAISTGMSRADIIARYLFNKRKIILKNDVKRLIKYDGNADEQSRSIVFQFNSEDKVKRILCTLSPWDKLYNNIVYELEERFEKLDVDTKDNISIWAHMLSNESVDEVDYFAILIQDEKGIYLGFSKNWREYGDKEEFLDNIKMSIRVFTDCLPENVVRRILPEMSTKDNNKPGSRKETTSNKVDIQENKPENNNSAEEEIKPEPLEENEPEPEGNNEPSEKTSPTDNEKGDGTEVSSDEPNFEADFTTAEYDKFNDYDEK